MTKEVQMQIVMTYDYFSLAKVASKACEMDW